MILPSHAFEKVPSQVFLTICIVMPYGAATSSTLSKVVWKVTAPSIDRGDYVIVEGDQDCDKPTWGYACVSSVLASRLCAIPLASVTNQTYLKACAPERLDSGAYGTCIFAGLLSNDSPVTVTSWLRVSNICYYPTLVADLAVGRNPKGINTTLLKRLKELGFKYASPSDSEVSRYVEPAPLELCCICLDRPTTHRWSKCRHNPEVQWGTICRVCRKDWMKTIAATSNKESMCPVCRTMGLIVKV